MLRRIFIPLFSILVATAHAQVATRTVGGKVTDANTREAIIGATCKALSEQGKILSYATTDGAGNYKLRIADGARHIVVSAMGYAELSMDASTLGAQKNISLHPETYSLKEVPVTVNPIEMHKDTIKYNVGAFKTRNDKYIEDVLRKMPGIEVKPDGGILYKGESINQFNIEGQNLLGNRYNQATRNLPVDAVAQVQVVENDQPVRVLKERAPSKRATLNIKLKSNYRLRPFGETILGGGKGYDRHTIWQNKITLINIGRKQQMLLNGSMNNSGTSLGGMNAAHLSVSDLENFLSTPPNMLFASSAIMPPLSEQRYLRNKDLTAGLNHLFKLGKYGNFRTNITYSRTGSETIDSTSNLLGGAYSFNLFESNRRKTREHTLNTELHYELNAPQVYFTNDLSGSLSHFTGRGTLSSNTRTIRERADRHPRMLQNKMSFIINSGRRSYGINSIVRYFSRNEWLDASTGHGSDLTLTRFATRNTLNTGIIFLRNALDLNYTILFRHDKVLLDTLAHSPATTTNSQLKNSLGLSYCIRYRRGTLTIGMPIEMLNINPPRQTRHTYVSLSPSLTLNHRFSPFLTLNMHGNIAKNNDDDIIAPSEYYRSYRTLATPLHTVGWTRTSSLATSLYYANLINMLTLSFTAMATWRKADHYDQFDYTDHITRIIPVWQDNRSRIFYLSMQADKSFPRANLQIKTSLNLNRHEMLIAQNGRQQTVKSNIASANLFIRYDELSWITFSHNLTLNLSWQDRYAGSRSQTLAGFYQTLTLASSPLPRLDISAQAEQNTQEYENNKFRTNIFLDATAHYTLSRRVELALQFRNLLDRRTYDELSYSGLTRRTLRFPLRGREFLLLIKLKI